MSRDSDSGQRRISVRSVVQAVLGIGLAVVLLVWGVPHFAKTSWSEVYGVVTQVPWAHALGYQALMLLGLWCYTFTLTGSLPGLRHTKALILNVCGSSVGNLLPGGGAAGLAATYTIGRSWGFTRRAISTSAIVTGVWNVLARITLPVIAIFALWIGNTGLPRLLRDLAVTGTLTGLAILAAFVAVIASERAAQAIGRGLDRALSPLLRRNRRTRAMSIDALVRDLRARISEVVRDGWMAMSVGLAGFFGVYYLLFVLIAKDTGVDLAYGNLFAAFAIGRLLTAVGFTPGGLGITEVTTSAVMVGWGADPGAATATVVLFSVFTHLMEVPIGGLGWVAWTLSTKSEPPPEGEEPSHADEPPPGGQAVSRRT